MLAESELQDAYYEETQNMNKKTMDQVMKMVNEAVYRATAPKDMGCAVAAPSEHPETMTRRILKEKADRRSKLIAAHSALAALASPFVSTTFGMAFDRMDPYASYAAAKGHIESELGRLELE
jgi:hypothetical protein